MINFSTDTETEPTPQQKRFKKFQDSAFGHYLLNSSENLNSSVTDWTNLTYHTKLAPIRVHKKPRLIKKTSRITPISRINLAKSALELREHVSYWSLVSTMKWNPETRQQAVLTVAGNKLFLTGGISKDINQDINAFNIFTRDWEKINTNGIIEPRFGHSSLEYSNYLFVFGGGTNFNYHHRLRECVNAVKKYSIQKKQWSYVKTSGTYISARKGHAASILGKHMLINGGFNSKNNVIHDTAVLDLQKCIWKSIEIVGAPPLGLAFHTAVSVASNTCPVSIHKYTDTKIRNYGIFIFGGIDDQKQASNTLYQIIPPSRPLNCIIPITSGQPPSPRFLHSMVYSSSLNCIVIFGGRVDAKNTVEYTCFNDVFILFIENLMWTKSNVSGNVPRIRSGHCAAILGSEMYVFGGVSNTVYCSSDMYKLEIDQFVAEDLIKSDERRKKTKNSYRNKSLDSDVHEWNEI